MRRGALLAAVLVVLAGAASASATTYAPVGRPGPKLSVPAAKLARSLSCSANLTSAGREPVLLVAGTTLTPAVNFSWSYEPALAAAGRPYCALTLPNHEMSDIQTAGEYVVNALRTMHARTGRKVEYVGYSQGGMVGRWALRFWPDTRPLVDDYVGIDPSNHGTYDANALCTATCAPSLWQQAHDSRFLTALNSGQETFAGIDYTVVYSNTDEVVFPNLGPGALSKLSGPGTVRNVAVQSICPLDTSEHLAMGTYDDVGWSLVDDAIAHAGPADPARISRAACLHPLMPGVDPATFVPDFARVGATAAVQLATYPRTAREPKLRSYVFG